MTDADAQRRLTECALASLDEQPYSVQSGIIRHSGRVWIEANSAIQTKLTSAFHSCAIGCHSRIEATYQHVKKLFAWHGLKEVVTDFIQQCDICQHAKHSNKHPQGLLQPLPIPAGA
jgi:hypothetical protein